MGNRHSRNESTGVVEAAFDHRRKSFKHSPKEEIKPTHFIALASYVKKPCNKEMLKQNEIATEKKITIKSLLPKHKGKMIEVPDALALRKQIFQMQHESLLTHKDERFKQKQKQLLLEGNQRKVMEKFDAGKRYEDLKGGMALKKECSRRKSFHVKHLSRFFRRFKSFNESINNVDSKKTFFESFESGQGKRFSVEFLNQAKMENALSNKYKFNSSAKASSDNHTSDSEFLKTTCENKTSNFYINPITTKNSHPSPSNPTQELNTVKRKVLFQKYRSISDPCGASKTKLNDLKQALSLPNMHHAINAPTKKNSIVQKLLSNKNQSKKNSVAIRPAIPLKCSDGRVRLHSKSTLTPLNQVITQSNAKLYAYFYGSYLPEYNLDLVSSSSCTDEVSSKDESSSKSYELQQNSKFNVKPSFQVPQEHAIEYDSLSCFCNYTGCQECNLIAPSPTMCTNSMYSRDSSLSLEYLDFSKTNQLKYNSECFKSRGTNPGPRIRSSSDGYYNNFGYETSAVNNSLIKDETYSLQPTKAYPCKKPKKNEQGRIGKIKNFGSSPDLKLDKENYWIANQKGNWMQTNPSATNEPPFDRHDYRRSPPLSNKQNGILCELCSNTMNYSNLQSSQSMINKHADKLKSSCFTNKNVLSLDNSLSTDMERYIIVEAESLNRLISNSQSLKDIFECCYELNSGLPPYVDPHLCPSDYEEPPDKPRSTYSSNVLRNKQACFEPNIDFMNSCQNVENSKNLQMYQLCQKCDRDSFRKTTRKMKQRNEAVTLPNAHEHLKITNGCSNQQLDCNKNYCKVKNDRNLLYNKKLKRNPRHSKSRRVSKSGESTKIVHAIL